MSPGSQRGVGVGQGDEVVRAEGEVQAGLVAQMFDPRDGGGLGPRPAWICSGRRPICAAPAGRRAEGVGGQEVDARLAEAGGDVGA